MADPAGSERLATLGLTGVEHNVLRLLEARLEWGNLLTFSPTDLGQRLGTSPSNISTVVRALNLEHGIIAKVERVGGTWRYMLDPALAWYGERDMQWRAAEAFRGFLTEDHRRDTEEAHTRRRRAVERRAKRHGLAVVPEDVPPAQGSLLD